MGKGRGGFIHFSTLKSFNTLKFLSPQNPCSYFPCIWTHFRAALWPLERWTGLLRNMAGRSQDGGVGRCGVSVSPQLGCLPATGGGLWCPRRWEEHQSELAACGILVPEPRVGPKLLRWELPVWTTGLTENLRPQGIFIRVRSHGVPHLSTKTQLYPRAYKRQCWKPQVKQLVRQEHNPTH